MLNQHFWMSCWWTHPASYIFLADLESLVTLPTVYHIDSGWGRDPDQREQFFTFSTYFSLNAFVQPISFVVLYCGCYAFSILIAYWSADHKLCSWKLDHCRPQWRPTTPIILETTGAKRHVYMKFFYFYIWCICCMHSKASNQQQLVSSLTSDQNKCLNIRMKSCFNENIET